MASGAAGNGTQASLEDMLSTDVDESVVNALKGSLESQLCDDPSQAAPGSAQFQQQPQQQQQPPQPLPLQQQQQAIVAPAQHFQVATSTAITTSAGTVITTGQQMQTVSAVPVTAGGQQQMSAMHNLANVACQQSPIVVQKPQIHVQVRPEGEKQAQPTGLQLVNVQRNIKPAGQRVILSPIRMATQPQVIRTSNISFPSVQLRPGTLLMRQDQSGQFQLLNMGGIGQPRLTVPVSTPAAAKRPGTQQVVIHPSTSGHVVMQPGSTMAAPAVKPLTVQTSHSGNVQNSGSTQNTASQMSPNTAKKKCKNFLATLIRLASDQPEQTATNVKALIQGLIDGNIPPEDFTTQLQRELNSSPQPCLVPFLKKSLPHLRQSLMTKELSIDGVRPPPPGSMTITQPGVPQAIIRSAPPTTVRLLHPTRMVTVTPSPRAILNTGHMISTGMTKSIVVQAPTPNKPMKDIVVKPPVQQKPPGAAPKPQVIRNVVTAGPNEKVRYGSALREDDDINDVAAMGGVNLQEESQRILASSDIVGATRSCGDDVFLNSSALEKRIHVIAKKHGLDTVDSDVIKLMSHAVQEKLKGYIERLNIISEHRAEPPAFKAEPAKFEPTSDVRSQLRFLDELDKLEKKRHEEHERELLIRVAKSRSKVEDPEQQKLKQRAKEMQKAEMEEMRQREANMTALQAIGFRKKPRLDGGPGASGPGGAKVLRPRIKRVNMKDMLFMLESDKHWMRSNFIYKSYLK